MKLYFKNKILINGLFPMHNFKIDGYVQKTGQYDESLIDVNHDDYIFYAGGYLIKSCYSPKDVFGNFYEYFENDELMEIEVSSDKKDKDALEHELLHKLWQKVQLLEKKLRLITNIKIGLPIYKATIYDENQNFLTFVGGVTGQTSSLSISSYDEEQKELLNNRLHFYISDQTLLDLESKNIRFKRAIEFYNSSFVHNSRGIRFALLFSCLESLFNLDGNNIEATIGKYGSKILFSSAKKRSTIRNTLINYYKIRSNYIHGNTPLPITEETEFNLREIVREILLIYWNISVNKNIYDANDMMIFLDTTNRRNLDLPIQVFIRSLYVTDYKSFYAEIKDKLERGETNILS